jgi:Fungal Zn(2)-Cys(6) binuclear cluster domain
MYGICPLVLNRIQCDSRLPDCSTCFENGLDCVFYDAASDREVPRKLVYLNPAPGAD